ncbi:MAG: ABC transporter ATP-binding protein, partial [Burkholderiales bacterium]
MPGEIMASLEVSNLSVRYGKVPALHEVSIRIGRGQVVTIIGANGAGKSTLMKAIMGLVKPVGGSVALLGQPITGLDPDRIVPLGIALVPEGRRLFAPMTVQENLEMGAYRRVDPLEVDRDMERVLQYFPDLKAKLPLPAGSLSGGQQQMVAVARALMAAPRVMMLDEPTIGLAPAV